MGYFTAKKPGTTTITIKYKGVSVSHEFTVVEKGTWEQTSSVKGLKKAANKMKSSIPKKITASNAFKYTKTRNTYIKSAGKYANDITSSGFLKEEIKTEYGSYTSGSCKLAVPEAGRYYYLDYVLYRYGTKNSPTSTRSSKTLMISSVFANTKQITVNLKSEVTAEHVLATYIEYSFYNDSPSKKKAVTYVSVYDVTADKYYTGLAMVTKGSKTIKIKLNEYKWDDS